MVSDNLENDVLGAEKCGINAIWYNPDNVPVPNEVKCINDLLELIPAQPDAGIETESKTRKQRQ